MTSRNNSAARRAARYRPDALYGIRPSGARAWRVDIRRRKVTYSRFFSAARYGTLESALVAAQAWRDRMALQLQPWSRQEFSRSTRSDNTSGHPGVYRQCQRRRNERGDVVEYCSWQARTPEGTGPVRTRNFSIAKYGEAEAYRLAVEAREAFVAEARGPYLLAVPAHLHPHHPPGADA
jgi:hypothetical protein